MKQFIITLGLILLSSSFAFAQFKQNDVELQLSGYFGSLTTKSSSTSGSFSSDNSVSHNYFYMAISPGYYIIDGLSIQPEFAVLAMESVKPAFYLLGNLSYTYLIPQSRLAPFIHVGYGVSNSIIIPGMFSKITNDMDIKVLNLGGGMKFLVSRGASLNAEVNYRSHTYSTSSGSGSFAYTYDYTYSGIGLLFGISIII